jgi:acyl-CoA reductase-like NAD-dependent aldehyde dehydrogenase
MSSELHARHWIDGEWVDAKDRVESVNPATGETIGSYTEATEAEAKRAIAAPLKAFKETGFLPSMQGHQRHGSYGRLFAALVERKGADPARS